MREHSRAGRLQGSLLDLCRQPSHAACSTHGLAAAQRPTHRRWGSELTAASGACGEAAATSAEAGPATMVASHSFVD